MNNPVNQVLALFNKAIRKVSRFIRGMQEEEVEEELDAQAEANGTADNNEAVEDKPRKDIDLDKLNLGAYAIKGNVV